MNTLKQRLISSILLWGTLAFVLIYFKLTGVLLLITAFSVGAQYELAQLLKSDRKQTIFDVSLAFGFPILYAYLTQKTKISTDLLYAISLILICNWSVFGGKTARTFLTSLFGFWYIVLNLHFFLKLEQLFAFQVETTLAVLFWIVFVTKLTDVGGFFVGCSLGKHRLAPAVSPKKTWEGVLGGFLFATIGGCVSFKILPHFPQNFQVVHCFIFSVILAWGSIVSDLLESLIKRQLQTKDSGTTIPGIGGILDLIDSLLLNLPLSYILFKYFVL